LSHVRNIKDADVVSHRLMFLDDARVLHRHEPPRERNHSGAEPDMFFVKRCLAVLAVRHERQPRLGERYRKRTDLASTLHLHPLSSVEEERKGSRALTFFTRGDSGLR
jgi:hypothetical protein